MATGTEIQLNQCIRFRSFRLMMLVFIFTTRINKSEGRKISNAEFEIFQEGNEPG